MSNTTNILTIKLLLYVLFNENENTLKHNFPAWEAAYIASETIVQTNESRFTYNVNPTWGDLESAINELENPDNLDETFTNQKTTRTPCESYDLQADLPHPRADGIENVSILVFKSQNILSLLKIMNTTE